MQDSIHYQVKEMVDTMRTSMAALEPAGEPMASKLITGFIEVERCALRQCD